MEPTKEEQLHSEQHVSRLDDTVYMEGDDEPPITWHMWGVVWTCYSLWLVQVFILSGMGFWHGTAGADVGNVKVSLWISQSYSLVQAILAPPVTRVTDAIGRKWMILGSGVFGIAAGIMFSLGKNIGVLIAAGCVWGIYFTATPAISSICSEVVPRRWRGVVQLGFNWWATFGNPIAEMAGAAAVTNKPGGLDGWRVITWLFVACTVVLLGVFYLIYTPLPIPNPYNRTIKERCLDFDKVGSLLLALGLTPFLMALIWGGNTYPWSDPRVIATLVVGLVFLVVFVVHQAFLTKTGLFHHSLFARRNFGIALFALFVEGIVYFPFNNFYGGEEAVLFDPRPLYFAYRYNLFCLGQLVAAPFYAYISYRYRTLKELLVFGFVCFLGAAIGLACVDETKSSLSLGMAAVAGVGFGGPISLVPALIQLSVPTEHMGVATALCLSCRGVGGTIGVAVCAAVNTAKVTANLVPSITNAVTRAGLAAASVPALVTAVAGSDMVAAAAVPGVTPAILAAADKGAKHAYAIGYRYVWIVQIPFVVIALGACIMTTPVRNDMNASVDRPVEEVHYVHHPEYLQHVQDEKSSV